MRRTPKKAGAPAPFRDVLRHELAALDQKALRRAARALIKEAQAGSLPAIKEIADRLDGKAASATDDQGTIRRIEVSWRA